MTAFGEIRLIAISDLAHVSAAALLDRWERLAAAAKPGSVAVDLREPQLPARTVVELGTSLGRIARAHQQHLIVNDRLDVAKLLGASAVHLREDSVASADARQLLLGVPILRACHRVADVTLVDAEAVLLSPILKPRKGNAALGLEGLRAARARLDEAESETRLFALGGIDVDGAAECVRAGADGVAAIGAAFGVESSLELLRALGIERP